MNIYSLAVWKRCITKIPSTNRNICNRKTKDQEVFIESFEDKWKIIVGYSQIIINQFNICLFTTSIYQRKEPSLYTISSFLNRLELFESKPIYPDRACWYNDDTCKWSLMQAYLLRNKSRILWRSIQQIIYMTDWMFWWELSLKSTNVIGSMLVTSQGCFS